MSSETCCRRHGLRPELTGIDCGPLRSEDLAWAEELAGEACDQVDARAREDGGIVGARLAVMVANMCRLHAVQVARVWRRRGIARALTDGCLAVAASRGATTALALEATLEGGALLDALGFVPTGDAMPVMSRELPVWRRDLARGAT